MFIMDERSFYYRRVVIRPRMSQASAERQITEQTRNRRPMVQTNRHTRDRVGIAGKEQTSARQLAISCINGNLTPELIKKSGIFTLSVLDSTVTFDVFKRFGLQSGRDVDKFEGIDHLLDEQGLPYLAEHADAMFSCKVVSSQDLGSHTLFIGEVLDAKVLSPEPPVTYGEYHSRIKPKPQTVEQKKIKGWKCSICGYEYEGETLPEDFMCPWCSHPASDFEPIYE